MANEITLKALQDASVDAKSLEDVVNGNDEKQVTTRLGETYPSVKKAVKTLFENGGLPATPFATKALMTASSLANDNYAMVTNDTVNNGLYVKTAGVWVKSSYDPMGYSKTMSGIVLNKENNTTLEHVANRAVKNIALHGEFDSRHITLSALSYLNGVFTVILASPDSLDEVMSASTNTKFIANHSSAVTKTGVQKLKLSNYGSLNLGVSGYITIDFDQIPDGTNLLANYIARERLIEPLKILNLNGSYQSVKAAKEAARFVSGTDSKNKTINDSVEKIVFFKPLPEDKYLVLGGLFRSADGKLMGMQIFAADNKTSKGVLWAQGTGEVVASDTVLVLFEQGYAVIRLDMYYKTNTGAAALSDDFSYETRGINKSFIKRADMDRRISPIYENQFVQNDYFNLPTDFLKRSVKLYIKGGIEKTDYYLLNVFNWTYTGGKYRLTYQIKKMSTPTQVVADGLVVYTGSMDFDSVDDIRGVVTINLFKANKQPNDAELVIDFTALPYRTDNNNALSPYIFNKPLSTWGKDGFDVYKLRAAASRYFQSTGGLSKYKTIQDALAVKETGLFAIGGNTFKSRTDNPISKADYICTNNPPKLLSKKPTSKEYDFYYKGIKSRLEIIDSDDVFYFVNSDYIIKVAQPLKQSLPEVANSTASDFTVFDVAANKYHSITGAIEVFTKTALNITAIGFVRLTYDNELLIISGEANRSIMFTENGQTVLRAFTFNGTTGTKYTFGTGVDIIKDWCMSHHKNIMFFSDYDTGTDRGTTGGQKAYVSLDNGYTFTQCFDFSGEDWSRVKNASNITSFNKAQAHIHSVCYDPKQNIVWIVTGDGASSYDNSSLFYSKDLGQTWTHMRSVTADGGARTQHVMALPFDGCVAFGSDASTLNGTAVATYDNDAVITQEVAQDFVGGESRLFAFARSTCSSVKHGVKYMSFGRNLRVNEPVNAAKSFVAVSSNGYAWDEVWSSHNLEVYGNVYCYDDSDGKLYVSLDGAEPYKYRVAIASVSYE